MKHRTGQNEGFRVRKCCQNLKALNRYNVYVAAPTTTHDHSAFSEMQSVVKGSEGHNGDAATQHKTGKEGKPQSVVKPTQPREWRRRERTNEREKKREETEREREREPLKSGRESGRPEPRRSRPTAHGALLRFAATLSRYATCPRFCMRHREDPDHAEVSCAPPPLKMDFPLQ